MGRSVAVCSIILLVAALSPGGLAGHSAEILRFYEVAGTVSPGPGGEPVSAYRCLAGQDTPVDAGACVGYFVGPVDFRDHLVIVTVQDEVFGTDVWLTVAIDMDGDMGLDCTVDICAEGKGVVAAAIPPDATGRYVQAFPAAVHTTGFGCCPDGNFGTRGEVAFSFLPRA